MTIQNNRLSRRISIGLAFCLISVLPAHAFRADEDQSGYLAKAPAVSRQEEPTVLQKKLFNEAEKAGLTIRRVPARSTPHSIRGTDLGKSSFSGVPGKKALRMTGNVRQDAVGVLDNLSGLMGIGKAADEFAFKSEQSDNLGFKHIRLNQMHRGLRVVGGEMIVHFDRNNKAYEVNGQYIPGITVGTTPLVTATTAERTAREGLLNLGFIRNVLLQQKPLLVIFAMNSDPSLAYELTLRADKPYPARWRIWIDARDGKTLLRYNDIKTINPPSNNGSAATITGNILTGEGGGAVNVIGWRENTGCYYLYNKTSYWYVYNVAASGYSDANTYAYRTNVNWGTSDRAEMSAARNFDTVQSYFRNVHGRNSFNNNNAYACANVHEDINYVNAYWDGTDFHFGDGDGVMANSLAVLDVCGHEYAHAVTENTAGLWYAAEYGALNESFSDIFGACVEFYGQPDGRSVYPNKTPGCADWLCGEDSWLESVALRDLKNPSNIATVGAGNEQPSRYRGSYWFYGTYDNGGVHINSGVQNFFFYLLSDGGSGVNDGISYSVNGIGIINAGKVAYRALTYYCHEGTDYLLVRDAWRSAATDINSGWVGSVDAAWNAVGCVPPPGDPNADAWDPGDDTGAGATQLAEPIDITQYHGPHVLTENDRYDWFKVYLTANNEYMFFTYGAAAENVGEMYSDPEGHNIVAGNWMYQSYKHPLFYTPSVSGWYYLRLSGIFPTAEYTLSYYIYDTLHPTPQPQPPIVSIGVFGRVTDAFSGYGVPDVEIKATAGITNFIERTDGNGSYTVRIETNVLANCDLLITPNKAGYSFNPTNRFYPKNSITNTIGDQNFIARSTGIVVNCYALNVPEGGTAAFQVKLSDQPRANVTVNVSRISGDSVISVIGGANLVFTPVNWNTYQTVTLAAAEDADAYDGKTAVIRCSTSGLASKDVTATSINNDVYISGTVVNHFGVWMPGVVINANNNGGSATSGYDGSYWLTITKGWSGMVTVAKTAGYIFIPSERNYTNVQDFTRGQDFTGWDIGSIELTADGCKWVVNEGGTVAFRVKLSDTWYTNIVVNVFRYSGDSNISVIGGASLTFTPTNWWVYQTVTLAAAKDADADNGSAVIRFLASDPNWGYKDQIFSEMDNDISISGQVKTGNGAAVQGVAINFSNNGGSTTNNAAGCYTQIISKGWSGAVTPSKSGYTFSPSSLSYSNVTVNQTNQNYTANVQVKITGYVNTSAGVGVDGVTLAFSNGGGTTTSDISGFYAKYITSGWSGTVTPSKSGYIFSPVLKSYSNVTINQVNQNYIAMVPVVTGAVVVSTGAITIPEGKTATFQVKLNTKPTANLTVNVSRYSGDSDISVSGGASLTFTPANWSTYQTVTLSAAEDADIINGAAIIRCSATGWTGKDVNAVEADNDIVTSLTISGYVKTSAGVAVAGATINFSNNGGSVSTDASGYYTKIVSKGWTGTATPSKSGCTFSPASRSYSNVQSSYTAQDYTATTVEIMPSPYSVTIPEGETATFNVKLSLQPAANITVNVSRYSGDSDVSVIGGASLTFTPANWNTYQTVTLSAAEDADTTDGTAIIRCSASGLASKDVTAFELDNDIFYTISGYIKDQYGKVATGAEVDFYDSRGDILMAKTDAKGYYAGLLYRGWSGEAWPFCTGVDTFSPAFRTYSNLTANKTNQNYTACKGVPGPDPMPKLAPFAVDTFGRDIDRDGLMDPVVYCEANGVWDSLLSASEYEHKTISMGGSGYKAALADFDGDHRADLALYRASDGLFAVALSGDNYQTYWMQIGGEGYVLVPGDYDGDGKADPAVYQSASGSWRAKLSAANYADVALDFGGQEYRAVPGDYDGDGKTDPAVCDEQTAIWAVKYSAANYAEVSGIFGHAGGKAVPADYDGDGKTDPAMYFDTNGTWEVWHSGNGYALAGYIRIGGKGFVPIPGDYDGDGLADPAVYNPETGQWRALLSGQGYTQRVEYLGKPVSLPVGMPP